MSRFRRTMHGNIESSWRPSRLRGIPDAIVNKPGQLDDEEWEFIRRHTLIGECIVRAAPSLAHIADLASLKWSDAGRAIPGDVEVGFPAP